MKLNLSGWRKYAHAKDHTVLQHEDGHQIRVMHSALSPKLRGELAKLPLMEGPDEDDDESKESVQNQKLHQSKQSLDRPAIRGELDSEMQAQSEEYETPQMMAGGGEADSQVDRPPVQINIGQPPQMNIPEAGMNNVDPGNRPLGANPNDPAVLAALQKQMAPPPPSPAEMQVQAETQGAPAAPLSTQAKAPQGDMPAPEAQPGIGAPSQAQAATDSLVGANPMAAAQELKRAVWQQQGAESEQAKAEADIQQRQADLEEASLKHYMGTVQSLNSERQALLSDIQAQHIDPSHYWNSKDAGSKVAAGIGLILGGIGAGATGGPNQALEFLNRNIDRDIQAQMANLGKKNTLLSANLQQFDNEKDAIAMTRIMQMDIVSNQLKAAAARAQDPLAKSRAMAASIAIDQQAGQAMQKLAAQNLVAQLVSGANKDPSKLQETINVLRQVDPEAAKELQQRLVPGLGVASTPGDADKVKELKATVDTAQDGLNRLQRMNKVPFKSLSPTMRAEAETIAQSLVGLLRAPITGPGALNEGERKMLEGLVANPTAIFSLSAANKMRLKVLSERLEKSLQMTANARGVQYDPAIRQGQEMQMRNGVPYVKVPGDWARVK